MNKDITMPNIRGNICNFALLGYETRYDMKQKYIIQFAKEVKYLFYVLIVSSFLGLIGFGIGKYYEREIKKEYNEVLEYQQKRKNEENNECLKQEKKLDVQLLMTKHEITRYVLNSTLKNKFIKFAKDNSLSIYAEPDFLDYYETHSQAYLNIETIKLFLKEKQRQELLQNSTKINIEGLMEEVELKKLIDNFDKINASINYVRKERRENTKSYPISYEQYRYGKGNLPEIIRKLSPLEIWGSTIIVILVLYTVLKIIILFVRIGTWINKTSKLDY